MVLGHEDRGMHLSCWFPRVISVWVALPVDKILESVCTSMKTVINNVLYFILRFSSDKVRWWPRVVGAIGLAFVIGGQKGGMEDIMNGPG